MDRRVAVMKTLLVLAPHPELADAVRGALDPEKYRLIHRISLEEAAPLLVRGVVDVCVLDVELAKAEEQRLIRDGIAINKEELRLRQRELRVHRKVLAEATPVVAPRNKPVAPQEKVLPPSVPYRPTGLY